MCMPQFTHLESGSFYCHGFLNLQLSHRETPTALCQCWCSSLGSQVFIIHKEATPSVKWFTYFLVVIALIVIHLLFLLRLASHRHDLMKSVGNGATFTGMMVQNVQDYDWTLTCCVLVQPGFVQHGCRACFVESTFAYNHYSLVNTYLPEFFFVRSELVLSLFEQGTSHHWDHYHGTLFLQSFHYPPHQLWKMSKPPGQNA